MIIQTTLRSAALLLMSAGIIVCAKGNRTCMSLTLVHTGTLLLLGACACADLAIWPRLVYLAICWAAMGVSQAITCEHGADRSSVMLLECTQAVLLVTFISLYDAYGGHSMHLVVVGACALPVSILIGRSLRMDERCYVAMPNGVMALIAMILAFFILLTNTESFVIDLLFVKVDIGDVLFVCAMFVACAAGHIYESWCWVYGRRGAKSEAMFVLAMLSSLLALAFRPFEGIAVAVAGAVVLSRYVGRRSAACCIALAIICCLAISVCKQESAISWEIWATGEYPDRYSSHDQRAAVSDALSALPLGAGIGSRIGLYSDMPFNVAPAFVGSIRIFGIPAIVLFVVISVCSVATGSKQIVHGFSPEENGFMPDFEETASDDDEDDAASAGFSVTPAGILITNCVLIASGVSFGLASLVPLGIVPDLIYVQFCTFMACPGGRISMLQVLVIGLAAACRGGLGKPMPEAEAAQPMCGAIPAPYADAE